MKHNKTSAVGETLVMFLRMTFVLWGMMALGFVLQIYFAGKASVADPVFLNPFAFTFLIIPVVSFVLSIAIVHERRKKGDQEN